MLVNKVKLYRKTIHLYQSLIISEVVSCGIQKELNLKIHAVNKTKEMETVKIIQYYDIFN